MAGNTCLTGEHTKVKKGVVPKPPKVAEKLLAFLIPDDGWQTPLGDFSELHHQIYNSQGRIQAFLWYWGQLFRLSGAKAANQLYWGIVMFKNYFKITIRNMFRHKGQAFINIFGLSVGIACCILIVLWLNHERSFDRFNQSADRIYRVVKEYIREDGSRKSAVTPEPLAPSMMEAFPDIEAAVRISRNRNMLISRGETHFLEKEFHWADPSIFDIFSLQLSLGDAKTALQDPMSLVISERMRKKYFGSENPIGQLLTISDIAAFKISAVMVDMPVTSHLRMDFMAPFNTYIKNKLPNFVGHWGGNSFYTYILLHDGIRAQSLEKKLPPFLLKYSNDPKYLDNQRYFLQPLTDIHLHSHMSGELSANVSISTLIIFSAISFFILFIACINYMNLATARANWRCREVGLKKVVGASRGQLIMQFWGESVFISMLSLAAGFFIVRLCLPVFNRFAEKQLTLTAGSISQMLPGLLLILLIVAALAGSYPSIYISSFKPVQVLRGTLGSSSKRTLLRNALVVMQFSISIILVIATLTVGNQLRYIQNKDMGYNREQIVILPIRDNNLKKNIQVFRQEIGKQASVINSATSTQLPNSVNASTYARWDNKKDERKIDIYVAEVDGNFTDLYGIEITRGRGFSDDFPADKNGAFIINEQAVKELGWDVPIGRQLYHWGGSSRKGNVVGVFKDIHLESLHESIKPLYFYYNPDNVRWLSIKISAENVSQTLKVLQQTFDRFSPKYPFEFHFFDDLFNNAYKTEQKMSDIFAFFSMVTIFIACLGLFGLTAFVSEKRVKEVGIRKVLGATSTGIVVMLAREMNRWVVIANLLAWPVAYLLMKKWLANFAYRINIGIGIFVYSALVALTIGIMTVAFHAIKSARSNPADCLRYE